MILIIHLGRKALKKQKIVLEKGFISTIHIAVKMRIRRTSIINMPKGEKEKLKNQTGQWNIKKDTLYKYAFTNTLIDAR